MKASDFKVGQEVIIAWEQNKVCLDTVTISKVGRKWVEVLDGRYRFEPPNLWLYSGSGVSRGRVWLSRAEYEEAVARRIAWFEFRGLANQIAIPSHLTIEQIQVMIKILKG